MEEGITHEVYAHAIDGIEEIRRNPGVLALYQGTDRLDEGTLGEVLEE